MTPESQTTGASRIVSDYEAYLFGEGHWLRAWEKLGARPAVITTLGGGDGGSGWLVSPSTSAIDLVSVAVVMLNVALVTSGGPALLATSV